MACHGRAPEPAADAERCAATRVLNRLQERARLLQAVDSGPVHLQAPPESPLAKLPPVVSASLWARASRQEREWAFRLVRAKSAASAPPHLARRA